MRKLSWIFAALCLLFPFSAMADIIDSISLAPVVPVVIDAFISVAAGTYEFFVGNGTGVIYVFIWGCLVFFIGTYLVKMYFPKEWLGFLNIKSGGEMWTGIKGMQIGENLLKPALRAFIAATLLLPIKPQYITGFIVDPFLQFGALYTHEITEMIHADTPSQSRPKPVVCPPELAEKGYLSVQSCQFLVQPVADITHANNQMIKRGIEFFTKGLTGLMTPIPRGGQDFMNLISGILVVSMFFSSNFFMALLIINAIFAFGMALILYPFKVLTFVVKSNDKWVDFWPPFSQLIESLKKLVITMIACAFILAVNVAIIKALFRWDTEALTGAGNGFSNHVIMWISVILTFYLMGRIFELTKKKLEEYAPGQTNLYNQVKGDVGGAWKGAKQLGTSFAKGMGWVK